MKSKYIFIQLTLLVISLISCVEQPENPFDINKISVGENGAYILCEGVWSMDNSTLERFDLKSGEMINNYFSGANPGMKLGDLANNIAILGDTAYIVVTTQNTMEAIRVSDGKSIGRMFFSPGAGPRQICIVNDTTGFVTDMYGDCLHEFNPRTLQFKDIKIPVGPAPEGIVEFGGYLFVANSGMGDFGADRPKAGMLSVVDIVQRKEIAVLPCGVNTARLAVNRSTKKIYAAYYHLYSKPDSLQGIVEFDAVTFKQLRHWRLKMIYFSPISIYEKRDEILFFNTDGVTALELSHATGKLRQIIENQNKSEIWYSMAVSPFDDSIWIGNAKNFQIEGEVLVYEFGSYLSPKYKLRTGINPNTILFF